MNQVILTVMKWLDNPESVSKIWLHDAARANVCSYMAADYASKGLILKAKDNVEKYFKETGEDRQKYLDEIKGEESMSEWEDGIPPVGSEVVMPDGVGCLYSNAEDESIDITSNDVLIVVSVGLRHDNSEPVVTLMAKDSKLLPGYATVHPDFLDPAKTQKQKDRDAFIEKVEGLTADGELYSVKAIAGMMFDSGFTAPEGGSDE